jgi:hypothetical protein
LSAIARAGTLFWGQWADVPLADLAAVNARNEVTPKRSITPVFTKPASTSPRATPAHGSLLDVSCQACGSCTDAARC